MKKNSAADELSYLVKLSKEGDKEAFSMLYEYIYMDLYRYALSVLKNPYFAEDAVSETVLSAYNSISNLRKNDAFKSWIFVILTNKCKKIASTTMNSYSGLFQDDGYNSMKDACDRMIVRDAFSELDMDSRIVVGLSVFAGFTSAEIAVATGKKPSSVRSIKRRALSSLRENLERSGIIYE
ncbi:MAG: RNA polymerase sigma factor [Lachnospiraceae bacterium]|nr:RNA polymerase sigma factor [Lachnospiraceae bacterium]